MNCKTLREYVEFMAKGNKPVNKVYQYILEHGECFEGALNHTVLPRSALVQLLRRKGPSWCYFNAQSLTLLHPLWGIEYYEGVADNGVFMGAHAWNLYEGKVVDITWEDIPKEFKNIPDVKPLEKFQYFGVKLPYEFVKRNNPIRKRSVEPLLFKYLGFQPFTY